MSNQPETHPLPAADGYLVPVSWYHAGTSRANLVLMAALGVPASFYSPLAAALHAGGVNVALIEQRGHGQSALRASRRCDFGMREALEFDIPAILDWLAVQTPGLPRVLMGHSLGGHYSAITAGRMPHAVDGVVLAACGSPWIEAFEGRTRRQLRLLVGLLPLLSLVFGYFPGDRLGFGGCEARRLMADWRSLALDNRYRANGLDEDLEAGIARYCGPVLSLRLTDDPFAPAAATAAVSDKFRTARLSYRVLDANELGDRADHFRWARTPAAVANVVCHWIENNVCDVGGNVNADTIRS